LFCGKHLKYPVAHYCKFAVTDKEQFVLPEKFPFTGVEQAVAVEPGKPVCRSFPVGIASPWSGLPSPGQRIFVLKEEREAGGSGDFLRLWALFGSILLLHAAGVGGGLGQVEEHDQTIKSALLGEVENLLGDPGGGGTGVGLLLSQDQIVEGHAEMLRNLCQFTGGEVGNALLPVADAARLAKAENGGQIFLAHAGSLPQGRHPSAELVADLIGFGVDLHAFSSRKNKTLFVFLSQFLEKNSKKDHFLLFLMGNFYSQAAG